jgi:hypothetical protein|tara:strand:+ start:587 stop:787 length:201 start_codon:yes stop_codon:yes gene_type:complete
MKDKNTKELAQAIVNAWNQPLDNETQQQFKKRIGTDNGEINPNECRTNKTARNEECRTTKETRKRF